MAQRYPERPIKIVVPWPVGGTADSACRVIAEKLSARLSLPVLVENKPGANGIVGTAFVARSAPDGYTIVYSSGGENALNPSFQESMPYDLLTDFVPITMFSRTPLFLVGRRDLPPADLKELIEFVRRQPGKLTYGSWGVGSLGHVGVEMILGQAKLQMVHVPYVGGPPAFNALLAGQIDLMLMPAGAAIPLRKAGRIRMFAVTARDRASFMPDVATMAEYGYEIDISLTNGFLAPSGTPDAVLHKLGEELQAVLRGAEVDAALRAQGTAPIVLSGNDYRAVLVEERTRWQSVVREAGLKRE